MSWPRSSSASRRRVVAPLPRRPRMQAVAPQPLRPGLPPPLPRLPRSPSPPRPPPHPPPPDGHRRALPPPHLHHISARLPVARGHRPQLHAPSELPPRPRPHPHGRRSGCVLEYWGGRARVSLRLGPVTGECCAIRTDRVGCEGPYRYRKRSRCAARLGAGGKATALGGTGWVA